MATTAGGGKKSTMNKTILKLERITLPSQGRSRASSFMNTKNSKEIENELSKEAYDSQSLINTYNTNNDFFGPPSKQRYQALDGTYHVPLKATKAPPTPAQTSTKWTGCGQRGRS
jgi:hypothetical protein